MVLNSTFLEPLWLHQYKIRQQCTRYLIKYPFLISKLHFLSNLNVHEFVKCVYLCVLLFYCKNKNNMFSIFIMFGLFKFYMLDLKILT